MFKARTTREWVLDKKVILMFKARTNQRKGSGQEGNIGVQSKTTIEIWL